MNAAQTVNEPRFAIGTKFVCKGHTCTIVDILKTFNSSGLLVRVRYVATHNLAGCCVTDNDVVDTTIAKGIQS